MGRALIHSTVRPKNSKDAWYDRRDQMHVERADVRSALLIDIANELRKQHHIARALRVALRPDTTAGKQRRAALDAIEALDDLTRNVMYTGHDDFASHARDLAEAFGTVIAMNQFLLPSFHRYVAWLGSADSRLGAYPR